MHRVSGDHSRRSHGAVPERSSDHHPVFYDVNESAISFPISEDLLAAAAERGDIVCFEADFTDFTAANECLLWSVVVVGKLQRSPFEFRVNGGNGDGATKVGADTALLPMTIVSGRAASALLEIA